MTLDRDTRRERIVVESFESETQAEAAIRALQDAGFTSDQISVLAKERERAENVADDTGADVAKGAGIGAATGAGLGALGGLLAGATALAIPGIGVVIAGPLAAVLGGAGVGAVAGGITGALTALGLSEDEANRYAERLEAGDILVAVRAEGREEEARDILRSDYRGRYHDRAA